MRVALDYSGGLSHLPEVRRFPSIVVPLVSLVVALLMLAASYWRLDKCLLPRLSYDPDADMPLPMSVHGEVDHRVQFVPTWQMARVPRALRFDPPMGSEHGALVYNAQKFFEMNESRGGHHMGDDLNGIGGMNTDLGDPVFSIADGMVWYAGESSRGWGKVIVIAHETKDGRLLQSMYAHLDRIDVVAGDLVPRGGKVGSVGTANGCYPAHLHFEMRAGNWVDMGAGYGDDPLNRLDPMLTVSSLRNASADQFSLSPLAVMMKGCADGPVRGGRD